MAELNYNGDKVNSVVSELTTIGGKFTPVANSVKTATGVMVGCKGFNLISDLTATSLSDGITACEQAIGALVGDIRTQQVKILTFSQDQAAIDAFVDSLSTAEYQALDLSGISSKISFWDKAGFVAKGGLNSSGAFFMGFGEGILNFAETIGDGVVMIGASAATLFTKPMDLINGTDLTTELWDKTKAYVAEEKVASAFDEIYANTTVGQQIKQNAYAFDTVRGIGKGIGYSTALAVTTGPNAILTPIAAGVAGMANGSEEAWGNGATTGKGLLYGAASGAWETVQWGAGMKINSIGKHVGDVGFKAADAFRRVGLDVLDSGVEGFVQPALTMIYQKYDGNSLAEKYAAAFESNGGWNGVLQQAVIGGMMSAGSEGMDVIKYKVKGGNKAAGVFDSEGEASTKPETDSDGKPKTEPADSSKGTGSKETNVTEMPVDKTAAGLIEGDSDVQLRAAIGKGTGDDVSVKNTGAVNVDSNARPETTLKPNTETIPEVNSVKIDVNSGKTDVNPVKTNATPARTDVSPVRTDATPARTDATSVRTDVNLVRTDASPARTDVSPVRTDATPSRTDVNLVRTDATPSRTDVNLVRTDASPVGTKPEVQMKQTGGAQTSVDTMRNATTSITSLSGDAGSVIKLGGEVAAGGAALTSVISKTSGVDINLGHGNVDVNTAGIDLDVNVRGGTDVSIRGGSNASVHSRADTNVRSDADVSVHGRTDASVRSDVDASTRGVDTSIKGDVDAGEFRLTGKETSDQMLDKIDKAVDDGLITRDQADKLIDGFSDTAHRNDLLEERAQLLQDRDANIERKELLINEDGAQPDSVKGNHEPIPKIKKHENKKKKEKEKKNTKRRISHDLVLSGVPHSSPECDLDYSKI